MTSWRSLALSRPSSSSAPTPTKAWVRRISQDLGIPVLPAPPAPPKGVRKEHFVQPFYRRLKGGEGIACVLTSLEQSRTFVSYTPRWTPASGDGNYRLIKACRKRFLHFTGT